MPLQDIIQQALHNENSKVQVQSGHPDLLLVQAVQRPVGIYLLDSKADAVLAAGLRNHDGVHIGISYGTEEGAGCSWHPYHACSLHAPSPAIRAQAPVPFSFLVHTDRQTDRQTNGQAGKRVGGLTNLSTDLCQGEDRPDQVLRRVTIQILLTVR